MDDLQWNKITGWVLTASIVALVLVIATSDIFESHEAVKPGYIVEGVETETHAAKAQEKPFSFYLANANSERGKKLFNRCTACHHNSPSAKRGIGPNLHDVVGRKIASQSGYSYSSSLKKKEGTWDFQNLSNWLKSPRKYAPGNKMSFAGLSKPQDRANIIAYLNASGTRPLALPAPPKEEEQKEQKKKADSTHEKASPAHAAK